VNDDSLCCEASRLNGKLFGAGAIMHKLALQLQDNALDLDAKVRVDVDCGLLWWRYLAVIWDTKSDSLS